jgi:D-xylonolactonase
MCVDTQGNVWSARWGGSSIVKISPEGKLLDRIELPALRVTSATFGGPELDELYLTSAGAHGPASPSGHDGAVFRIRGSGARGSVEFRSRIRT